MALIELDTLADTSRLGRILAEISREITIPILLRGGLGSGKTTLTREIVSHLPGGDKAEVASPSFTVCNLYPVSPQVLHCDLYRCREEAPEDVEEFLEKGEGILIVEWGGYLRPKPKAFLDILLNVVNNARSAELAGRGPAGIKFENRFEELWNIPHDTPIKPE